MNELQNLFVLNPNIKSSKKKYIWFDRNELIQARSLLEFFIMQDIYVDGFVSEQYEDEGICVWNKKICYIESIDGTDSFIFSEKKTWRQDRLESIFIVNPGINKRKAAVYGAGRDGLQLLHTADELGITICMFIDSDCKKAGKELEGVQIYEKSVLNGLADDVSVIIAASAASDEIDKVISEYLPDRERYRYNYREINSYGNKRIAIQGNEYFWTHYMGRAREVIKDKKVFLYGMSERSRKIARIYELLDFCVEGYIDDETERNDGHAEKRTIALEEIIYEADFFILISRSDYYRLSETFENLGLVMLKDFGLDNPFQISYVGIRNEILDINLGHSFVGKQGMCGFSVLGNSEPQNIKIAVLGASTAEDELYSFKSWPKLLFERINNKNVTIYNGSVAAYNSAQELIKLLRDILFIKPDMVVVYDGSIDMLTQSETDNPFAFYEMQTAMDFVNKYKNEIWLDHFSESVPPFCGIKPETDIFDRWLSNIKRMKLICESEQIKFFSFFQPTLFYKESRSKDENGLLWSAVNDNTIYQKAEEFKKRIRQIGEGYDYIYDLSDIFNHEKNIYIDECHVFEKGNQLIADSVFEVIGKEI